MTPKQEVAACGFWFACQCVHGKQRKAQRSIDHNGSFLPTGKKFWLEKKGKEGNG